MATTPEEIQQQPKLSERVINRIAAPVSDYTNRQRVAFVLAAAISTTAPLPLGGILAAVITWLAYDRKR